MSSGKENGLMLYDDDVSLRQAHGVSGTQVMWMHKVGGWEVNVAVLRWLCNLSAWRFVVILLRYSDSLDCEQELAVDKIMSSGSTEARRARDKTECTGLAWISPCSNAGIERARRCKRALELHDCPRTLSTARELYLGPMTDDWMTWNGSGVSC
jgi:hypothetical protein